jgi:hypothetical protein
LGGPSDKTINQQNTIAQGQLDLAKNQQQVGNRVEGIVEPGLKEAENYYQMLAKGDPKDIMAAIGPAVGQIGTQTEAAKKSIASSTPRGGAQDLALAEADISKAGQVGNLETQAYTGAFPALASLFQGGAGISVSQIANAISSASGAASTTSQIGNEQAQGKASTMGFLGSLAGAGGEIGAGFAMK